MTVGDLNLNLPRRVPRQQLYGSVSWFYVFQNILYFGFKLFLSFATFRYAIDIYSLKSGGGTIIYLRDGLQFRVRGDLNTADNECTWVELIRKNCKPLLICCIYRPPDQDCARFISELDDCLSKIDLDKCELILLGDFNVDQYNGCKPSLKINFQRRLTKCQVPTDWCLTRDILCLTKNINAIEQI